MPGFCEEADVNLEELLQALARHKGEDEAHRATTADMNGALTAAILREMCLGQGVDLDCEIDPETEGML